MGRNETNIAYFAALVDPGDGSLLSVLPVSGDLTNRIDSATTIELGENGVLDLGTNTVSQTLANLYGSGIVSNGMLAVTGCIAPGGTNAIGTLTIANSVGLSGTLLADVATDGSCDLLSIVGDIDLSHLALQIANPAQLNTNKRYTVVTVSGSATGALPIVGLDACWHVRYIPNDGGVSVVLSCVNGTLIQLL